MTQSRHRHRRHRSRSQVSRHELERRWISGRCCRPRRRRRGSSIWPSGPRRTGSATCGRSTRTSCGRSRTSSTARSSHETRNIVVGPMVTNPAHARLDRHGVDLRHAQRDVRQPHGLRHRPRRLGGARHQRQADHARHDARVDPRDPRARQRPQRRLQGLDDHVAVGDQERARGVGRRLRARRRWR